MPQKLPDTNDNTNANVIIIRPGGYFSGGTSFLVWNENSPLPPCARYTELADMYALLADGWNTIPDLTRQYVFGYNDTVLPKDSAGNIRRNLIPCGVDVSGINFRTLDSIVSAPSVKAQLDAIYSSDSMWTGEVVDPVIWQDDYWDALLIDREAMQIYLDAHPGCRLNS